MLDKDGKIQISSDVIRINMIKFSQQLLIMSNGRSVAGTLV